MERCKGGGEDGVVVVVGWMREHMNRIEATSFFFLFVQKNICSMDANGGCADGDVLRTI